MDPARIPVMEADLILDSDGCRIILDTKYYTNTLAHGRGSGTGKLHSENLYQLLAYLPNRQAAMPEGPRHEGILLYPQVSGQRRADIHLEGFRIQDRTVDLNQEWQSTCREMLETVGLLDSTAQSMSPGTPGRPVLQSGSARTCQEPRAASDC